MNVLVQLNSPLGSGVGPNFTLTSNVGTVIPPTATATQLLAGIIAIINNSATSLTITPIGTCSNPIVLNIPIPITTTSTSSTTTTTIAPLCQCMLIYNTNTTTKTIQYVNCSNQIVGIPLAANGSIQVCGSNVTFMDGVIVTLGGPCISSQTGYVCTSCAADKCKTYLIRNTSTASQTFQYVDCTGASVTATVQGRVGSANGQINICSCNAIQFPVGSVLQASEISVDCILCKCYKIYNPTKGTLTYTWTDCEKFAPTTQSILAGEIQYKCTMSNGFTPNPALVITVPDSACTVLGAIGNVSPSLLPICDKPQSYCYTVTTVGQVVYQYVTPTGILTTKLSTNTTLYLCAWQNSIVKTSGTGTLTVSTAGSICQFNWECEPCLCYTVYNKSGSSKTLSYVNCNSISPGTQVIANNGSFTYCGKYPLNPDDFAILQGGECTISIIGSSCNQITTTTTTLLTTTTTAAPTTTTTTLVTNCYRIANSTASSIVATYYDATGFPNFITVPAQTSTTYQCASSIALQAGLTIANVGDCSYFKCTGLTTTTTTATPTTTTSSTTSTSTTSTSTSTSTTTAAPTTTSTSTTAAPTTTTSSSTSTSTSTSTTTTTPLPNFISTWRTVIGGETITLPLVDPASGGNYNGIIDWGDGTDTILTNANWNTARTHTYGTPGDYVVTISAQVGNLVGWKFWINNGDYNKIRNVLHWGCLRFLNDGNAFRQCANLTLSTVDDTPTFTGLTTITGMFRDCQSLTTINNLASWNVSSIQSFNGLFLNCFVLNDNFSSWNMSSATNIGSMFSGCDIFNNGGNSGINNWNTSSVTIMSTVFENCRNFNQPVGNWNTFNVTTMANMFNSANAFNQDISNWRVSNVTNMSLMFNNCYVFNQDISKWERSTPTTSTLINVTTMNQMLFNCRVFNQNINNWNVSNVTNMQSMFGSAYLFNQNLNSWNTSNVTNMISMFENARVFNGNITSWDTSKVTSMYRMFSNIDGLGGVFNQAIGSWNTGFVTNMQEMFYKAYGFNQNISTWNVSNVTNLTGFMEFKTSANYSTANYDALLNAWSLQTLKPSVVAKFGTINYTIATAQAARNIITGSPNNWTIQDGGGI